MLAAVFIYSLLPVMFLPDGGGNALSQVAVFRLGVCLGWLVVFLSARRGFIRDPETWRRFARVVREPGCFLLFTGSVLAFCDIVFFVWVLSYLDGPVVTVIFWTSPALMICYDSLVLSRENRSGWPLGWAVLGFLLLSFAGGTLSAVSPGFSPEAVDSGARLAGVGLSIVAVALCALQPSSWRLGRRLGDCRGDGMSFSSLVMGELASSAVIGGLALLTGDWPSLPTSVWYFGCGFLVLGANLSWIRANLLTSSPAVNALLYLSPGLSVLWLALIPGGASLEHWWLLLLGLALVTVSNLLLARRLG